MVENMKLYEPREQIQALGLIRLAPLICCRFLYRFHDLKTDYHKPLTVYNIDNGQITFVQYQFLKSIVDSKN
jgi:hypothetical protein